MPVTVRKVGNAYKVVEATTGRVTPSSGTFSSAKAAAKQAAAINIALHKRGK